METEKEEINRANVDTSKHNFFLESARRRRALDGCSREGA
jgi:hypothetical protein